MKKRYLLLGFMACTAIIINAQTFHDVVYLKNGSIIRGTITEETPRVSITIQTADKSIYVYKIEEIEKYVVAPRVGVDRGSGVSGRKKIKPVKEETTDSAQYKYSARKSQRKFQASWRD